MTAWMAGVLEERRPVLHDSQKLEVFEVFRIVRIYTLSPTLIYMVLPVMMQGLGVDMIVH